MWPNLVILFFYRSSEAVRDRTEKATLHQFKGPVRVDQVLVIVRVDNNNNSAAAADAGCVFLSY